MLALSSHDSLHYINTSSFLVGDSQLQAYELLLFSQHIPFSPRLICILDVCYGYCWEVLKKDEMIAEVFISLELCFSTLVTLWCMDFNSQYSGNFGTLSPTHHNVARDEKHCLRKMGRLVVKCDLLQDKESKPLSIALNFAKYFSVQSNIHLLLYCT